MKRIVLAILFFAGSEFVFAQDYKPVDEGSSIKFKLKNFGFNSSGSFSGLQGNIHFDASNPAASRFDVSIDANSINTGIDIRDNHLRDEDYFAVKKYPLIYFVSTSVNAINGSYEISGHLTIKDKSKEISFPFTAVQSSDSYIFNGEFKISRKDFGIGSSGTLSDIVSVSLNVVAKK
jgi:polyisoprenoid-binding protein YceI